MAAVLTFKDLQDRVLAWLDEVNDQGTTLTLVKNALNESNKKRATQEKWSWMKWDSPELLTINAGQQTYALHSEYLRPYYFWNRTAQSFVEENDDNTLADNGDWNTLQGAALRFEKRGLVEVQNQPSSPSAITVTSSRSEDNGAVKVTIRGVTPTGVASETVTCGSSSAIVFTKILKVTKSIGWIGTMTMKSNTGTVTNLVLFANEAGRAYQQIFFLRIPQTTEIIEYVFYRQPFAMTDDNDRPDVPSPFEELLVWDTLLSFAAYNQYDPQVVRIWQMKQAEQLLALQQADDTRAVNARAEYTTYVPR